MILPKLFRRLIEYLAINRPDVSLAGFPDFLAAGNDRLFVISQGRAAGLVALIEVNGQQVRLTEPPENLVFIEA